MGSFVRFLFELCRKAIRALFTSSVLVVFILMLLLNVATLAWSGLNLAISTAIGAVTGIKTVTDQYRTNAQTSRRKVADLES